MFKRTDEEEGGCFACLFKIVEYPLNFLRNYTTPMADFGDWDRNRASILPLFLPAGFTLLQNMLLGEKEDGSFGVL